MSDYYEKLGFIKIESLVDVETPNFCVKKGDYLWTSKSDAKECEEKGLAKIAD